MLKQICATLFTIITVSSPLWAMEGSEDQELLQKAVRADDLALVRLLNNRPGITIDFYPPAKRSPNPPKLPPLGEAVRNGHDMIALELLQSGASANSVRHSDMHETILATAVRNILEIKHKDAAEIERQVTKKMQVVDALLLNGANIAEVAERNNTCASSILHMCARHFYDDRQVGSFGLCRSSFICGEEIFKRLLGRIFICQGGLVDVVVEREELKKKAAEEKLAQTVLKVRKICMLKDNCDHNSQRVSDYFCDKNCTNRRMRVHDQQCSAHCATLDDAFIDELKKDIKTKLFL